MKYLQHTKWSNYMSKSQNIHYNGEYYVEERTEAPHNCYYVLVLYNFNIMTINIISIQPASWKASINGHLNCRKVCAIYLLKFSCRTSGGREKMCKPADAGAPAKMTIKMEMAVKWNRFSGVIITDPFCRWTLSWSYICRPSKFSCWTKSITSSLVRSMR